MSRFKIFDYANFKKEVGGDIPVSAIDLSRFKKNPVMLHEHGEGNKKVIGSWGDIELKGNGDIYATACFDTNSEIGKEVSRQVESGHLRGASIGFRGFSENKCEVHEASIVAVPQLEDALKLSLNKEKDTGRIGCSFGAKKEKKKVVAAKEVKQMELQKESAPAEKAVAPVPKKESNKEELSSLKAELTKLRNELSQDKKAREEDKALAVRTKHEALWKEGKKYNVPLAVGGNAMPDYFSAALSADSSFEAQVRLQIAQAKEGKKGHTTDNKLKALLGEMNDKKEMKLGSRADTIVRLRKELGKVDEIGKKLSMSDAERYANQVARNMFGAAKEKEAKRQEKIEAMQYMGGYREVDENKWEDVKWVKSNQEVK